MLNGGNAMSLSNGEFDVLVVGAGNAALSAALAARDAGASVLVLEAAPEEERGGNSRFTGGLVRFVYDGVDDLRRVMPDLSPDEIDNADFGAYPRAQFFEDLERVTQFRADPDLSRIMIDGSLETMVWLQSKGVRFIPAYGHQAYKVDGKFKFWGGLTVLATGGGKGLVDALTTACRRAGVTIVYETRAESLIEEDGVVRGVVDQVSWAGLGPGEGTRHALQSGRRHSHGAGDRCDALWQLVRCARGCLGSQRS
jgi:tricarballylate dehydrogenase